MDKQFGNSWQQVFQVSYPFLSKNVVDGLIDATAYELAPWPSVVNRYPMSGTIHTGTGFFPRYLAEL